MSQRKAKSSGRRGFLATVTAVLGGALAALLAPRTWSHAARGLRRGRRRPREVDLWKADLSGPSDLAG